MALLALVAAPAAARPLDDVLSSGTLVIAVYRNFAPWSFEESGTLTGIDVEIGRLLAEHLHVAPKFLARMPGEDVDSDLRANVWRGDIVDRVMADVMLHVPVDKELGLRNDMVVICCAYEQERMAVVVDPEAVPAVSFGAFRNRKIAVEGGSTADLLLSALYNGAISDNVRRATSFEAAVAQFSSGEVPALMATRAQVEWAAAKAGRRVSVEEWPLLGVVKTSWPVGLATRVDAHDLAYALEDALTEAAKDGRLAAIHARFNVTWQPPAN
ncbi:substrate-binding periplasmic protein [Xanthobacter sp. AM11]|uniref:substrate-binding periplasmic protein n=1 Tax=Xanthobacter sp. AM11 TaxID=3380643 RepID=UPI0039BF8FB8